MVVYIKLDPVPEILESLYDDNSLIYQDDDSFLYGKNVNENLIKDIKNNNFQIYNCTYRTPKEKEYPIIWIVGRGRTCGKQTFHVENFFPYCYFPSNKGKYKTYLGEKVDKVLFESEPRVVGQIRKHYERSNPRKIPKEADIPFTRRFLIDTYNYFKPDEYVNPSVCIMDLETNFPINNNIISFAINGYDKDKIYYNSLEKLNKYELVLDLYVHLIEYDIIANWNVDFDIEALVGKLEKLHGAMRPLKEGLQLSKDEYIKKIALDYNLYGIPTATKIINALQRFNIIKEENGIIKFGDIELNINLFFLLSPIDLMKTTKKMYAREISGRWSLDNVGHQICGIRKIEYEERYPRELSPELLEKYNKRDVEIPKLIDDKMGGILCHVILAWSLQSTINDVMITAVVNDIALLRAYHRDGIVLPSRPPYKRGKSSDDEESYTAAEPDARPGVYKDVSAGDLDAAYPSAVMSLNASCETKDPKGKYIAPNGVRFNDGYSTFIEELKRLARQKKDTKNKLKKLEKGSEEWKTYYYIYFAIKTQVAAFSHGIFGWKSSRMKDLDVADAITSMPREIIELCKTKLDEIGHQWIYSHTDSTYFIAKKDEAEDVIKQINTFIEEYCNERGYKFIPFLDYEGYFPKAYIHSPARNVMVKENGEWKPTGMNYYRSEVPKPLGDIEKELIALKLDNASQSKLIERLRKMILELKDLPSSSLGIVKPLTKSINKYGRKLKDGSIGGIPYHIKALIKAKKDYGLEVKEGEKFRVIPIVTGETEGVRVIRRKRVYLAYPVDEELPDIYEIDYENYLRSNLWGKICNLFDTTPKKLEEIVCNTEIRKKLKFEDTENKK
jgi:DNA polymerase elongation subunit (family B)